MPKLLGLGYALPHRRVDNEALAVDLGISAGEIEARTGARSRYYAAEGEGPSDLAKRATAVAFAECGGSPADVDLVIFATMTPDFTFPGSACFLQDKLGCGTTGALDVRAQCAGFLFALEIAHALLDAGGHRRILVAAGDVHSSGLDFTAAAADVTPLFGDGAAAAVVDAAGEGLLGSVLRTDGSALESFWCEYPASRRFPLRFVPADLEARNHFPRIDHERVARDGLEKIVEGVEEVLSQAGVSKQDVNRYVLHHVFPEIAERAARKLGVAERTSYGGRDEGHVASASLPIALCRAREQGLASTGDLVCLATAGAGVNWGASLVRL